MKLARTFLVFMVLIISLVLASCSSSNYRDGIYYAEAAEFGNSGWKETVEVTIENGKISKLNWDAVYKDESIPIKKKQYSKSGLYGMLVAGAIDEWYGQALAAEKYVIENGIDSLELDDGGYTDAIAGCTIHINEFEKLILECLKQAKK